MKITAQFTHSSKKAIHNQSFLHTHNDYSTSTAAYHTAIITTPVTVNPIIASEVLKITLILTGGNQISFKY